MSFARQMKQAMDDAELSQMDLCALTGLSKSSISQYLSGKILPSQKSVAKIAEALNCSVMFFYMDSPNLDDLDTRNVSIAEAARRLGKSGQFVRIGLQTGRLPFGTAVQMTAGTWSYHISPKLFDAYIGKSDDR
jgi:transcriptional regulator with XRE-family HTH domain